MQYSILNDFYDWIWTKNKEYENDGLCSRLQSTNKTNSAGVWNVSSDVNNHTEKVKTHYLFAAIPTIESESRR